MERGIDGLQIRENRTRKPNSASIQVFSSGASLFEKLAEKLVFTQVLMLA